ncbi:Signal transducing adapter molecule 1 [Armadillidium nasatum]|uniref:Signal transducing adapter molecule 1 n=1 Tax=Armadillidium nasatum TaxID=96803 RepID=A0A5N5SJW5_9CRUS|nr:Signal transducing adapter molecule 1 [Armadillidium nasatum]
MGLFSNSSPFDTHVERATSENNTNEDWSLIMDVCDRVKESPTGPKDCLKSITKRLNNDNPRVALQTVTLLDACINNCGRRFHLEVAGREFEQELLKLITSSKTHHKVSQSLRENLKKWVEEFKGDPELSLIPALYTKLQKEGFDFEIHSDSLTSNDNTIPHPKKTVKYSTDPNVVQSAQEEEDIAKAIQLSLQETGSNSFKSGSVPRSNTGGLYSNASAVLSSDASTVPAIPEKEPTKVRALYDFEAAEDNELTFKAGEIIIILDNSDANWWKGTNHRGEGLFPANFVTTNLEGDISFESESSSGKRVSFSECVEVTEVEETPSEITVEATGEIDEDKIDQLLHLLHEADPTGERSDDPSLPGLEEQVNAMAPNIDAELERIDKKHAQLARISAGLVDALGLYHQLMREMPSPMPYYSPYSKIMPGSGEQNMGHLQYPSQNMPQPQMYPQTHYAPYGSPPVSGIPPQYLPPHVNASGGPPTSVHIGTPTQTMSSQPPASAYQPLANQGGGPVPNFSHYNQGSVVPPDQVSAGMPPNENVPTSLPPSSATSQQLPPSGIPTQMAFPHGHPMGMPSNSQVNLPPLSQPPIMSLQQQVGAESMTSHGPQGPNMTGSHNLPPNLHSHVPPVSMGLPNNVPIQAPPVSMPQGPPSSMPQQGPINMLPIGPPTSMAFYGPQPPQPQMHSMQQPLL